VSYLASLGADSGRERERFIARAAVSGANGSPERGAALFHRHCAPCHGEDGAGGGAAASRFARPTMNLRSGRLPLLEGADGAAAQDATLARAIRFGIPPLLMPGHEWLDDREVADLAAFVRRLGASSGPPS
jgi:cytochrome c oxidase cbb3-type subunit 3